MMKSRLEIIDDILKADVVDAIMLEVDGNKYSKIRGWDIPDDCYSYIQQSDGSVSICVEVMLPIVGEKDFQKKYIGVTKRFDEDPHSSMPNHCIAVGQMFIRRSLLKALNEGGVDNDNGIKFKIDVSRTKEIYFIQSTKFIKHFEGVVITDIEDYLFEVNNKPYWKGRSFEGKDRQKPIVGEVLVFDITDKNDV